MPATKRARTFSLAPVILLLSAGLAFAQLPMMGREYAELTRLRPAGIYLANQTIMVQVTPVDQKAAAMAPRLKKLITNRVIGVGRNLREVSRNPYYLVDCSITNYDYNERTEQKKLLLVKDQGTFKIITASLEASFKVVRTSSNTTLISDNVPVNYKDEFQVGIQTAPIKDEVENALIKNAVKAIIIKLSDTEEKFKVRLMGKGDLSRFARLAQAGQWTNYIESLKSLPEQPPDKKGESSFEGDRNYDLAIAYEARFYETMWKDYERAEKFYGLADSALRKAQQFDAREKEYINAQARLLKGKEYFDIIKERFPKDYDAESPDRADGQRSTTPPSTQDNTAPRPAQPSAPGGLTNKEVIKMFNAGVPENLIIQQINEAKVRQFDMSPQGIIDLTTAGVSEKIIARMKGSNKRAAPKAKPKSRSQNKPLPTIKPKQ